MSGTPKPGGDGGSGDIETLEAGHSGLAGDHAIERAGETDAA